MKKVATTHYFKIKFDNGLTEYANCFSESSEEKLMEHFLHAYNKPEEWAKGNILESITPCVEMEYTTWSLAVKMDFHKANNPN